MLAGTDVTRRYECLLHEVRQVSNLVEPQARVDNRQCFRIDAAL
jgi:hypothetical protein